MKCKILSLFFLVGNLTAFGSDSDSVGSDSDETNSILRKQVYSLRSDADFEADFLNEFKSFPATIFSPAVQAKIIEKVPSLEAARGKSGEEFKGELIQSAVLNAISSAAAVFARSGAGDGAGDGSSAGAGGSSTASRVSPVRSRAGARKTTDYYGGDRRSGRDADKRHRRYGSADHEDDTEPLA